MTLDQNSVEEFARKFHDKYDEESILEDITNRIYWEDEFDGLDYTEIGRRVGLPIKIINDDADPVMVISSFCRSLRIGERNYVASELNDMAEDGSIRTIPIEEVNESVINSWQKHVNEPDQLILPLDKEYHSKLHWRKALSKYDIDITWIPLKYGIENGFLYNSSNVTVVQKWFNEMEDPPFNHELRFNKYSQNRPLALYFGKDTFIDESQKSEYQKQVDFLFSISLSELLVSEHDVIRLEPQKELEGTD